MARRVPQPQQTAPLPEPVRSVPVPAAKETSAPDSFEEALRQIRQALGQAEVVSVPAPKPPPSGADSSARQGAEVAHSLESDFHGGWRTSDAEESMPETFDERFERLPAYRGDEFVGLEKRAPQAIVKQGSSIPALPAKASRRKRATPVGPTIARSRSAFDLKEAIVWTVILGPPRSRTRGHRP